MKRREVNEAHEDSVLNSFTNYCEKIGDVVKIVDRPEPPDAIVTINEKKTWIEITDAFFNKELAESITTHVADDKVHKPVPKEKRRCINPDEQFGDILESVIIRKYDKSSIGGVYKKFGSGILLVGIINPFSDAKELVLSEKERIMCAIKSKEPRFAEIYLYDVHDHVFCKFL